MALDNTQIAIYGVSFLIFFAVVTHIFATLSGTSLFNLLQSIIKTEEKKTYKYKKIPDDRRFVLSYPSKNFKALINGKTVAGTDDRTGKEKLRFNYGEDKMTDFSILADPAYFRIAKPSMLGDSANVEIEIVDSDSVAKLTNQLDNSILYGKSLEKQLQDSMENEKSRLGKEVEAIRERKKVAFGWTGSGQPTGGLPYRPWTPFNRYGGGGYNAGQSEEEQF